MKIVSQFKDYYDHQAHLYGGGDPKIVYLRNRLKPLVQLGSMHYVEEMLYVDYPVKRDLRVLQTGLARDSIECKYLCVAGKYFLCMGNHELEVLDPIKHPIQFGHLTRKRYFSQVQTYETLVGVEDPDLVGLSRAVGAPVFVIEGYIYDWRTKKTRLTIRTEVPILGDLGLPAIYPAEQLYQDLSYFIGNKMKDSPDLQPPTVLSDKDRIVQHGFDLKKSFRHRL